MRVQIKLEPGSKVPVKGEPNAMCYDCYVREIEELSDGKIICHLGFSATPPKGYGIRLIPRSNLTKYWWVLNNSIGVGDEDFKNEYRAVFTPLAIMDNWNRPKYYQNFPYKQGERVCQMEIYKREDFEFKEVDILPGNDRGGGIGSTGMK